MLQTTARYETGIGMLDRKLGGGIPAGSIVALRARPASQSELLLYQLATQRETLYLTARRTTLSVRTAIESSDADLENIHVHAIDHDDPLPEIESYVDRFRAPTTVVVDPMNVAETADESELRRLLASLQDRLIETDSVAVLHCLDGQTTPARRDLTTYMADIVFDLETFVDDDRIENRLSVPKFRGGPALKDALQLDITERVVVDNSRDIG